MGVPAFEESDVGQCSEALVADQTLRPTPLSQEQISMGDTGVRLARGPIRSANQCVSVGFGCAESLADPTAVAPLRVRTRPRPLALPRPESNDRRFYSVSYSASRTARN